MRRITGLTLMLSLIIALSLASYSATKPAPKKPAPVPVKPAAPVVRPVRVEPVIKEVLVEKIKYVAPKNRWLVKAGVFGSAGKVSGGFENIINDKTSLLIELGYGFGNNYTVASWSNALIYQFTNQKGRWNPFVGMEINYSDYSKKVVDVPGINTIEKGGALGAGILAGISQGDLIAQIGYDSRSGAIAEIGYRIGK